MAGGGNDWTDPVRGGGSRDLDDLIAEGRRSLARLGHGPMRRAVDPTPQPMGSVVEMAGSLTEAAERGDLPRNEVLRLRLTMARLVEGDRRLDEVLASGSRARFDLMKLRERLDRLEAHGSGAEASGLEPERRVGESARTDVEKWVKDRTEDVERLRRRLATPHLYRSSGDTVRYVTSMRHHVSASEFTPEPMWLQAAIAIAVGVLVLILLLLAGSTVFGPLLIGWCIMWGLFASTSGSAFRKEAPTWESLRDETDRVVSEIGVVVDDAIALGGRPGAADLLGGLQREVHELAAVLSARAPIEEAVLEGAGGGGMDAVMEQVETERARLDDLVGSPFPADATGAGRSRSVELLGSPTLAMAVDSSDSRWRWFLFDASWQLLGELVATTTGGVTENGRWKRRRYEVTDLAGRAVLHIHEPVDGVREVLVRRTGAGEWDRAGSLEVKDPHLYRPDRFGQALGYDEPPFEILDSDALGRPAGIHGRSSVRGLRIDLDEMAEDRPLVIAWWLLACNGAPQYVDSATPV